MTCFDKNDNDFNLKYMFIRRLYCFVLIFIINKCIYWFDKRPNIEIDNKLFLQYNHILGEDTAYQSCRSVAPGLNKFGWTTRSNFFRPGGMLAANILNAARTTYNFFLIYNVNGRRCCSIINRYLSSIQWHSIHRLTRLILRY